jgi:hypothetical protein
MTPGPGGSQPPKGASSTRTYHVYDAEKLKEAYLGEIDHAGGETALRRFFEKHPDRVPEKGAALIQASKILTKTPNVQQTIKVTF